MKKLKLESSKEFIKISYDKFAQPIDKCVLVDKDGKRILLGFSKKELKEIKENPEAFNIWLDIYGQSFEQ